MFPTAVAPNRTQVLGFGALVGTIVWYDKTRVPLVLIQLFMWLCFRLDVRNMLACCLPALPTRPPPPPTRALNMAYMFWHYRCKVPCTSRCMLL